MSVDTRECLSPSTMKREAKLAIVSRRRWRRTGLTAKTD